MARGPRVLLAGLFHETHTFLDGKVPLAEFACLRGEELWRAEGDGSPLAGVLEVARAQGWEVVPAIDLRATPGPLVTQDVVEEFSRACAAVAAKHADWQGVMLVLHGAMVSEACRDVEGEVLTRLRLQLGRAVPICAVLDLHGNLSPRMVEQLTGCVVYRENPHADACVAARDAALLLDRLMRGGEPTVHLFQPTSVMWPPPGTGTAFEPMATLERLARTAERRHPELLAVNVFAGFSFADTPDTGVSFSAVALASHAQLARTVLQELAATATEHRAQGLVQELSVEEALQRLDEHRHESNRRGPVVWAEPSDNIGGGAPGDGTALLRALVEQDIPGAVVAINDPAAVQKAAAVPVGSTLELEIGGHVNRWGGGPVTLPVTVVSQRSGKFLLEDRHSHLASMSGDHFDMGPCAVVRHRGVTILLTTHKTPPFDLGQWRSQGIVPEEQFLIAVKAAVAHRRVYLPIEHAHYTVSTPGPCASDLRLFPFQHVTRPKFPLDE